MSTEYDNLFEDDEQNGNELPKKLRAKIDELNEQLKAAREENHTLKSSQRNDLIGKALSEKGYSAKIARFIPNDMDLEKLDEWLTDNAEVFAPVGEAVNQQSAATRDADRAAAIQRMASAEANGSPAVNGDVLAKIGAATTLQELQAALSEG